MLTLDFLGNKKKVSFLPQMQLREMDTVVLPFPPIHSLTSGLTAIPCGGHLKPVTRGCKSRRNGRPPCLSLRQTEVQFQRSRGMLSSLTVSQASISLCPTMLPLLPSRCTSSELPPRYTFHRQLSTSESISRESNVRFSPR